MTATQPCTATVPIKFDEWQAVEVSGIGTRVLCGEPVAELRPVCAVCMSEGNDAHCRWHPLAKRLVHVTLGPCEECEDVAESHPVDGWIRFEWAETARPEGWWYYRTPDLQGESDLKRNHPYAPTVAELPMEHEAERATPPVEEAISEG